MGSEKEVEEGFRRQSGRFASVTGFTTILVIALMLFNVFHNLRSAVAGALPGGASEALLSAALFWLPGFFFLWGLWAIWRIFKGISRGDLFGPAIGAGLTQLGWALLGGGAASAVAVPNLLRWSIEAGLVSGITRKHQGILHFDMAYVMLVLLGGAILLLGKLIRRAGEYRAESVKLQAELDEFF